tara:strand:- start:1486 stop:2283 length:798 start_codon:yes stop_codon:yes gene_type:complete
MHPASYEKMKVFFQHYLSPYEEQALRIMDLGSRTFLQDESQRGKGYRPLVTGKEWEYVGVDLEHGKNVHIVLQKPYDWQEIETNSLDVIICGQVFEHIQFFWVTLYEMARVLKDGGLICIIVPSTGGEHRSPMDCWRVYPDGLATYCEYIGFKALEIFTEWEEPRWSDSFLVMQKPRHGTEARAEFLQKNALQKSLLGEFKIQESHFSFDSEQHESIIEDLESKHCLEEYRGNQTTRKRRARKKFKAHFFGLGSSFITMVKEYLK